LISEKQEFNGEKKTDSMIDIIILGCPNRPISVETLIIIIEKGRVLVKSCTRGKEAKDCQQDHSGDV